MKTVELKVHQCSYCDLDAACGFNGESYDYSHDECHHPFSLEEAKRIVACWNYFIGVDTADIIKLGRLIDKWKDRSEIKTPSPPSKIP